MTRPPLIASNNAAAEVESIFDRVRSEGGRITEGRRVVIEALYHHDTWVTAAELVDLVRPQWDGVNESTAYRVLELLERLGVVRHTHLGHGASYWYLSDSRGQTLVCEGCGTVVTVPAAWMDALAGRVRRQLGFVLAPHHFAWSGYCAACSAAPTD